MLAKVVARSMGLFWVFAKLSLAKESTLAFFGTMRLTEESLEKFEKILKKFFSQFVFFFEFFCKRKLSPCLKVTSLIISLSCGTKFSIKRK